MYHQKLFCCLVYGTVLWHYRRLGVEYFTLSTKERKNNKMDYGHGRINYTRSFLTEEVKCREVMMQRECLWQCMCLTIYPHTHLPTLSISLRRWASLMSLLVSSISFWAMYIFCRKSKCCSSYVCSKETQCIDNLLASASNNNNIDHKDDVSILSNLLHLHLY